MIFLPDVVSADAVKTRINKFQFLALAIVSVVGLSGCIGNKQYRTEYPTSEGGICNYDHENDCPASSFTRSSVGVVNYDLGFIEFDDQGFLFDREQKRAVMSQVREIVSQGDEVIMLTFIHGWNHNANGNEEDGNIQSFRKLLRDTATENPSRRVVGLYIGWRGQSLRGGLTYTTFWGRKKTAHEVGQNGFTTTLLELEDIVKSSGGTKSSNTMVTIGHSFGGAALFSSIKNVLAERYIQSRPFGTSFAAEGFGDLVVIVNPAFESLQYQSLYELAQDECRPYPDDQVPRLVILSAYEDKAVRLAFPVGRSISTLLESHRSDASARYCTPFPVESEDVLSYQVNQRKADLLAVGHHEAYVTHLLRTRVESDVPGYQLFSSATVEALDEKGVAATRQAWTSQARIQSREIAITDDLVLISKNRVLSSNPYLNVFSQDQIITGHNDIWNPKVRKFIEALIHISVVQ